MGDSRLEPRASCPPLSLDNSVVSTQSRRYLCPVEGLHGRASSGSSRVLSSVVVTAALMAVGLPGLTPAASAATTPTFVQQAQHPRDRGDGDRHADGRRDRRQPAGRRSRRLELLGRDHLGRHRQCRQHVHESHLVRRRRRHGDEHLDRADHRWRRYQACRPGPGHLVGRHRRRRARVRRALLRRRGSARSTPRATPWARPRARPRPSPPARPRRRRRPASSPSASTTTPASEPLSSVAPATRCGPTCRPTTRWTCSSRSSCCPPRARRRTPPPARARTPTG